MKRPPQKISAEQEIMILHLWAQAMDIARTFSAEEIRSVRGLREAIDLVAKLPEAIGWGTDGKNGDSDDSPRRHN